MLAFSTAARRRSTGSMSISPRPPPPGSTRSSAGLPPSPRNRPAAAPIAPRANSSRLFATTSNATTPNPNPSSGPRQLMTSSPASSGFVCEFLTQHTSLHLLFYGPRRETYLLSPSYVPHNPRLNFDIWTGPAAEIREVRRIRDSQPLSFRGR